MIYKRIRALKESTKIDAPEDFVLARDDRDELCVLDDEGQYVFHIPLSMDVNTTTTDVRDLALIEVAILLYLQREEAFKAGQNAGRRAIITQIHDLLGVDRLVSAIRNIKE